MTQNKYTGEMAFALSMMSLISAMHSAQLMQQKTDKLAMSMLETLDQRVKERAPKEALEVWGNPMFREIMREFIGQCGLTTIAVLQVYKKFENECKRNKNVC